MASADRGAAQRILQLAAERQHIRTRPGYGRLAWLRSRRQAVGSPAADRRACTAHRAARPFRRRRSHRSLHPKGRTGEWENRERIVRDTRPTVPRRTPAGRGTSG